ncbi:MAG TPA: hypothetical protein VKR06_26080 [Ktedonosporobacter sp.]|nr:hypothetical protein [Ktedonosporobacter sp.]
MLTDLLRIRREHNLTSAQLAEVADLPLRVVYLGEIGGLVDEEDARKILKALSRLTGKIYTLETIALNIKEQQSYEPTLSGRPANHSAGPKRPTQY